MDVCKIENTSRPISREKIGASNVQPFCSLDGCMVFVSPVANLIKPLRS